MWCGSRMGNARSKRNVGVTHVNGAAGQLSEVYTRTGGRSNGGAAEASFGGIVRRRARRGRQPVVDPAADDGRGAAGTGLLGAAERPVSAIAREPRIRRPARQHRWCAVRDCLVRPGWFFAPRWGRGRLEHPRIASLTATSTKRTRRRPVAPPYRADHPIPCMGALGRPVRRHCAALVDEDVLAAGRGCIAGRGNHGPECGAVRHWDGAVRELWGTDGFRVIVEASL